MIRKGKRKGKKEKRKRNKPIYANRITTLLYLLWQPLITKTNDYTSGKSLSWISSGEFTRELDKEPLLN